MSRPSLVLLVILAVALAGCGALDGDSQPSPSETTVTPVPVPSDTPSQTSTEMETPPGISPDGRIDVEVVHSTHLRKLANESFSFAMSGEPPSGSGDMSYQYRVAVENESRYFISLEAENATTQILDTGDERYVREYNASSDVWNVTREEPGSTPDPSYLVSWMTSYLGESADRVDQVDRDGTTYTRVFFVGPPGDPPADLSADPGQISNYTATLYVRPDGFIRTVVVNYELESLSDDAAEQRTIRFRNSGVGTTTVETPEWVRNARTNRTANESTDEQTNEAADESTDEPTDESTSVPTDESTSGTSESSESGDDQT